jgi:hypothetical protein
MTTWTISTLERTLADPTDGVIVAHWRATETETVGEGDDAVTYSASNYGTCGFTPDASSPDWTDYDDVTEAMALNWCWAELDKDAIEASLSANIDLQKNPTQASGVPW